MKRGQQNAISVFRECALAPPCFLILLSRAWYVLKYGRKVSFLVKLAQTAHGQFIPFLICCEDSTVDWSTMTATRRHARRITAESDSAVCNQPIEHAVGPSVRRSVGSASVGPSDRLSVSLSVNPLVGRLVGRWVSKLVGPLVRPGWSVYRFVGRLVG